jgi:hypothetical protein
MPTERRTRLSQPPLIVPAERHGRPIVAVELTNHRGFFAAMDPADFAAWRAAGRSLAFFLRSNSVSPNGYSRSYVSFYDGSAPGQVATVSRAILNPGEKWRVRHLSGDTTDLRRVNLTTAAGKPGRKPKARP